MKETQPDGLFSVKHYLPDVKQNEMDAEFRDIFELSPYADLRAIRIAIPRRPPKNAKSPTVMAGLSATNLTNFYGSPTRDRTWDLRINSPLCLPIPPPPLAW